MPTPALHNFLTAHPRVGFRLVTAATGEPVSAADAMAHARVDDSSESTYVSGLVSAARAHCEMMTGRGLSNEVRKLYAGDWSQCYDLDRTPIASITSVTYLPEDYSAAVTVDTGEYLLCAGEPDRVVFKNTFTFPALADRPDAVTIQYQVGASILPPLLLAAIKMIVADLYDLRTESITGTIISKNPRVQQILESHRIGGFAV